MAISKKFTIGTCKTWGGAYRSIKIEVSYSDDGRLSICGSKGGSGGQIDMEFDHRDKNQNDLRSGKDNLIKASDIHYAAGWNAERWMDLLEIWSKYHLNDMNAACIHQEALGWGEKQLTFDQYELTTTAISEKHKTERRALDMLKETGTCTLTEAEKILLSMSYSLKVPEGQSIPYPEFYVPKGKTTQWSGHTRMTEHPEGVLCKPCPECGYEYGTAWLKRDVPLTVIRFLNGIEADEGPLYPWDEVEKTREYLYIKF
jgi:hypothetical protein